MSCPCVNYYVSLHTWLGVQSIDREEGSIKCPNRVQIFGGYFRHQALGEHRDLAIGYRAGVYVEGEGLCVSGGRHLAHDRTACDQRCNASRRDVMSVDAARSLVAGTCLNCLDSGQGSLRRGR
jgi:hypothetical protein